MREGGRKGGMEGRWVEGVDGKSYVHKRCLLHFTECLFKHEVGCVGI